MPKPNSLPTSLLEQIITLQRTDLNDKNASQLLLYRLFDSTVINDMQEQTWSSASFFSNQRISYGNARGHSLAHKIAKNNGIEQSDKCNKNRINLEKLPRVLALSNSPTNYRFVVLDINGSLEIFFAACYYDQKDMTHSQLACSMNESTYCVAAGEIGFTNIKGQLCVNRLSNFTEQFKCPSETLSVVLDVLLNNSSLDYAGKIKFELTDNIRAITTVNIDFAQLQWHYTAAVTESENKLVSLAPQQPQPILPPLPMPTVTETPQDTKSEVASSSNLSLFSAPTTTKRALAKNDDDDEQANDTSSEKFHSRTKR